MPHVPRPDRLSQALGMHGIFRDNARTRMEFLELIKRRGVVPSPAIEGAGLACVDD